MNQRSYRERIVQTVVTMMKTRHDHTIFLGSEEMWVSEIFSELCDKYPKMVTYRMLAQIMRDKKVFEDVTPEGEKRVGRRYRLNRSIADRTMEEIMDLVR
jgi:hypothetical protein